jgi:hypothetical protein
MDDKKLLDLFGRILMENVRDRSIDRFDQIKIGALKSKNAIELHELLKSFDSSQLEVLEKLVVEAIDNSIYNTLDMFEQHSSEIEIFMLGKNLTSISDGLPGELFTSDGWIDRFSKGK